MDNELEKAKAFIGRLLTNPALQKLSPLQKEEQILYFLQVNAKQLFPTLSSPAFFNGKSWDEIVPILGQALFEIVDLELKPKVRTLFDSKIDLSFIHFLRKQNTTIGDVKEATMDFLNKMLTQPGVRRALTGSYIAIVYRYVDRYIDQAFERKQYVHFELVKVQKLKMGKEEIKNLIKVSLLLKPSVHFFAVPDDPNSQSSNGLQREVADKIISNTSSMLMMMPPQVIESAIRSNISFQEEDHLEATARISAILGAMCKTVRPNMVVDKGAESQDKSWFNTARRNYKYYGFDIKILDEFYQIAAENGW